MFTDKYTGRVKWFNVVLAKMGILGTLALGIHCGAHYSPYIQNLETAAVHGLRQAEYQHYRGDAMVEVRLNRKGNIERHLVFLPADESYALGEDGFPKEPEDLIEGIENRLRENPGHAEDIIERIEEIEKKY